MLVIEYVITHVLYWNKFGFKHRTIIKTILQKHRQSAKKQDKKLQMTTKICFYLQKSQLFAFRRLSKLGIFEYNIDDEGVKNLGILQK